MYAIGGLALLLVSTSFGVDLVIKADKIDDFKIVDQDVVRNAWEPMGDFPMWLWLGGAVLFALSIFALLFSSAGMCAPCFCQASSGYNRRKLRGS